MNQEVTPSDLVEVRADVRGLRDTIDRLENDRQEVRAGYNENFKRLFTAVFGDGNGNRGLNTRMATTETEVKGINTSVNELKNRQDTVVRQNWAIIIAVVGAIIAQVILR